MRHCRRARAVTVANRRDDGSAVPVMVAVLAVICAIGVVVTAWGGGMVRATQARGAADLSALAAAEVDRQQRALGADAQRALVRGCEAAAAVASANGAALVSCHRAAGYSVLVEVMVSSPRGLPAALATSRAGPRS